MPVVGEFGADECFFLGAVEHSSGGVDGAADAAFGFGVLVGDELDERGGDAEFAEAEEAVFAVEESGGADEDGDLLAVLVDGVFEGGVFGVGEGEEAAGLEDDFATQLVEAL